MRYPIRVVVEPVASDGFVREMVLAVLFLVVLALGGCAQDPEQEDATSAPPVAAVGGVSGSCRPPSPEVGYATNDGVSGYWSECLVCDGGTSVAITWGPLPPTVVPGVDTTGGPTCLVPGGGPGPACAVAQAVFDAHCRR